MDLSASFSFSTDDGEPRQEELVKRYQLRLWASQLRVRGLARRSPDTFAAVTCIVHKKKVSANATQYRNGTHDRIVASWSMDCRSKSENARVEWGSTEVIQNSASPHWIKSIPLQYKLGSECHFYVRILPASSSDWNNSRSLVSKGSKDCYGTAYFEVGEILGSHKHTIAKQLKPGGWVYARLEPDGDLGEQRLRFRFQFQALSLVVPSTMSERFSLASAPTTILEIARPHPSLCSWVTVFRSRPVINSNNPCWDLADVDLESCCRQDDPRKIIRLSVYRGKNGGQSLVGLCETTMDHILAYSQEGAQETTEKDFFLQKNMKDAQQVGRLRVKVAFIVTPSGRRYSAALSPTSVLQNTHSPTNLSSPFSIARTDSVDTTTAGEDHPFHMDLTRLSVLSSPTRAAAAITLKDFVDNGGQLEVAVAIDFTSSNGNPLQPGTLHFQSDEALNDYEETIRSIGYAIDNYNRTSEYCVWGFGAKFGDGVLRHLFQCGDSTVQGVQGILDAYRSVIRSGEITMSGPTVLVNAIQAAAVRALNHKIAGANIYTILLIVTDGEMDSFQETKEKLSIYGEVPLSVVIVGVGRTDFQSMYALCESPPGTRKNTTFVEFRGHQHDPRSLAQAALRDIPQQLSDFLVLNEVRLPRSS